eukprot:1161130-Pelagomonas_calceolata.AAC.7
MSKQDNVLWSEYVAKGSLSYRGSAVYNLASAARFGFQAPPSLFSQSSGRVAIDADACMHPCKHGWACNVPALILRAWPKARLLGRSGNRGLTQQGQRKGRKRRNYAGIELTPYIN